MKLQSLRNSPARSTKSANVADPGAGVGGAGRYRSRIESGLAVRRRGVS
jgi:hypothetical protein